MPEGDQDHGAVALAVAIALGSLDQLLDLALGQVFAGRSSALGRRIGVTVRFSVAGETSLMFGFAM